ncbi:MAG TPA: hypothetical protein VLB12_09580, partial [Gemmatimonadales bacterium]|nr:hypothetical protein [Gemmatimonadales bacterium]
MKSVPAPRAEPDGGGTIEERQLDAVGGGEESVPPVHADRGDDHHGEHDGRTDRAEEAEGDQHSADQLAQARARGVEAPRLEAELPEELAGRPQTMAAEPSKELLCSVRRDEETDHQPRDQESEVQHRSTSVGVSLPSFKHD